MLSDYEVIRRKKARRRHRRCRRLLAVMFFVLVAVTASGCVALPQLYRTAVIERLREDGCPEDLVELAERNPEALTFVMDYSEKAGRHEPISVAEDIAGGGIPLFLQWDERWGYETYGSNYLALTGCGPTSLAMVCCGLTGDASVNPWSLAQKAEDEGYYVSGSGTAWSMMTAMASELGLASSPIMCREETLAAELVVGRLVICSMGPGDFTTSGHFIVLTGLDSHGDAIVNDPNSRKNSGRTWPLDKLAAQMKGAWSFSVSAG